VPANSDKLNAINLQLRRTSMTAPRFSMTSTGTQISHDMAGGTIENGLIMRVRHLPCTTADTSLI
jgi:hypothetical protein